MVRVAMTQRTRGTGPSGSMGDPQRMPLWAFMSAVDDDSSELDSEMDRAKQFLGLSRDYEAENFNDDVEDEHGKPNVEDDDPSWFPNTI